MSRFYKQLADMKENYPKFISGARLRDSQEIMEEFNRRLGKSRKHKKDRKRANKPTTRQKTKSDDKLFAALNKHRKSNNLLHTITSERLTVRPGLFENAIKSDVIHKEDQDVHMQDDVKAVLDEDLFQFLDTANRDRKATKRLKQNTRKTRRVLTDFDTPNDDIALINDNLVVNGTTNDNPEEYGTLFRDIQEQYDNVTAAREHDNKRNFADDFCNPKRDGLSIEQIEKFVHNALFGQVTDPTELYFKEVIDRLCLIPAEKYTAHSMMNARKNERKPLDKPNNTSDLNSSNDEPQLFTDECMVPCSSPEEPGALAEPVQQMDVVRCRTPDNQPVEFPQDSYRTPENQKYTLEEPPPTVSKYEPGIYVVPPDYQSAIRDDSLLLRDQHTVQISDSGGHSDRQPMLYHVNSADRFTFNPHENVPVDFGISRIEKRPLTGGKSKNSHKACGECSVFERPKKMFKCDLAAAVNDENAVPETLKETREHSTVYSRPQKLFMYENNLASPVEDDNHDKLLDTRRKLNYNMPHVYSSQSMNDLNMESAYLIQDWRPQNAQRPVVHDFIKPRHTSPVFARKTRDRVPLRDRYSPNELNLRKKYAPQTLRSEELKENTPNVGASGYFMDWDLGVDEIPKLTDTPDVPFKPRFHM